MPCHLEEQVLIELNPLLNESTKLRHSVQNEETTEQITPFHIEW